MDVHCAVCGEPYYKSGVFNGSMLPWERDLFLKGVGCPCCEGYDPHSKSHSKEPWGPPPMKHFEDCKCEGCGVGVGRDPETGEAEWFGGKAVHYHRGYAYEYGEHSRHESAAHYSDPNNWIVIDGERYCPGCATECSDCTAKIFTGATVTAEDAYAEGAAFLKNMYNSVCIDCYERLSAEGEVEAECY